MALLERVPEYIRGLVPYPPGKPIEELEREYGIRDSIKLASNESPIGPSPLAIEAVRKGLGKLHLYPDGSGYYLKEKLSERLSVTPQNLILGNGSNEIIELIARTFLNNGDEAVMGDAAFIVYQIITDAIGGEKVVVPLKEYRHDLEAMAGAVSDRTRVIFVANPNNPTGTAVTRDDMESFFESVPDDVLIVMDEAYYEYAISFEGFQDSTKYLKDMENLIVLRTFSKAYGLAGLRVGYGIASEGVISVLERVRQPFNVNSLALAGAEAALDDYEHIKRGVELNSKGMSYIKAELDRLGLPYVDSMANFILFDAKRDGDQLYTELLKKGVIVRPMRGYGLESHIRVTIGLKEENKRFIDVLEECI